jgi:hypothetical protein
MFKFTYERPRDEQPGRIDFIPPYLGARTLDDLAKPAEWGDTAIKLAEMQDTIEFVEDDGTDRGNEHE